MVSYRLWLFLSGCAAALISLTLSGCGTALNSSSPSSSGTIQPQSQPAAGPALGYVWDASSQALRIVQGVPGSSIVGSAAVSAAGQPAPMVSAVYSTRSGEAVFLDTNGNLYQAPLTGGKLALLGNVRGAQSLSLSNSGGFALVVGKTSSEVPSASVVSGLPQSPVIQSLDTSSLAAVVGGVISDTGTAAIAATASSGQITVSAFGAKAAGSPVVTLQSFGGMQFIPGSDSLVVADASSGLLTEIAHVNTSPSATALQGSILAPNGLDVTADGHWVVAANHAGDLLRIDLTGATAAVKLHCSCSPTQVLSMASASNGTTVRLVAGGLGPLWIVDAGDAAPRVRFIPAITAAAIPTVQTKTTM